MRTVPFLSVLNAVASGLGLDPVRDLNQARAAALTTYVNARMLEGWKFDFWPEWTVSEQRAYRAPYAAATAYVDPTLTAAQEVFFYGSVDYYQALRATTGTAPATSNGGAWTTNDAYWALCQASYSGADWAAGNNYALTDVRRNPDDNRFYQCHTAHASAGAAMDLTKFGVLTPFQKYVDYDQAGLTPIDEVKLASRKDSTTFRANPGAVEFTPIDKGILLGSKAPALVWLKFRLRPPQFTSVYWTGAATFATGALTLSRSTGECYVSLQDGNLNHDPAGASAAYWERVKFPAVLASFVTRAAAADALKDGKQTDRAVSELEAARDELADALDRALAAQGQFETAGVQTYGS